MIAARRFLRHSCSGLRLLAVLFAASAASAQAATSYEDWCAQYKLSEADSGVNADPDGDGLANALEYAYGTNPTQKDSAASVAPFVQVNGTTANFVYKISPQSDGNATFQVMMSQDMKTWTPVPGTPTRVVQGNQTMAYHPVPADGARFYALEVQVKTAKGDSVTAVPIGTNVGADWEGLEPLANVSLLMQPPAAADGTPNYTKYPVLAGASQTSFTSYALDDFAARGLQPARRSWMGWFLWGNGTPPPGISPGYPVTGTYTGTNWDFFSYQYTAFTDRTKGTWNPIRLDQQPLFLSTWTLNYNWAPGMFGYVSKPLQPFKAQTSYWSEKQIVRGVNLSRANPFFYQYGDYLTSAAIPTAWRQAWFYLATRPVETAVVVPSNLKPSELLANGAWNKTATGNDPFPYPVWDDTLSAADQTPFNIQVDRADDWSADLIWEATRPGALKYAQNHYQRSADGAPGKGNYMKMSVAQGSPLVWCETNNNKYAIFYNLIRTNLKDQINNNTGTNAGMIAGGPFDVPGVAGVKYVLLYGDQTNPNQWYQEVQPWYFDAGTQQGGGFNPAPSPGYKTKSGASITPAGQHNHTYTAVYYREDTVEPVVQGNGVGDTENNNGTDTQGNPYFYLQFKNTGKNWFVVGAVPEMRYYNSAVPNDDATLRDPAAIAWAGEMGKYAFNFIKGTRVDWAATNMFQTTTTFSTTLANPYVAAGASGAAGMTADSGKTVMALNPHQYQPITLGPDLTKAAKPEVKWPTLRDYGADFPTPAGPPNANRTTGAAPSRWGYWNIRGNLRAIVSGSFKNVYPFQNFLPNMPSPDLDRDFTQTGIAAVNITNIGTGYKPMPPPNVTISSPTGQGATFEALVDANTGQIKQINVITGGEGYPNGMPAPGTKINIDFPKATSGTVQAEAYAQISGGAVVAVFMTEKGAGYAPIIKVTQTSQPNLDPAIVVPQFDKEGNMLAGAATVNTSGAGFDFSKGDIKVEVIGTGQGATAELVAPGKILDITLAGGPFGGQGRYPLDGPNTNINVLVPPPADDKPAQTASAILSATKADFIGALVQRGDYTAAPTAYYLDDAGNKAPLLVFTGATPTGGVMVTDFAKLPETVYPTITSARAVIFEGVNDGTHNTKASGRVYPTAAMGGFSLLGSPAIGGYTSNLQVAFSGGEAVPNGVKMPVVHFKIAPDGTLAKKDISVEPMTGITYPVEFAIFGGRGEDAQLLPVIDKDGHIIAVRVLRGGSHYIKNKVFAWINDTEKKPNTPAATLDINVNAAGTITDVAVTDRGAGYSAAVVVFLVNATDGRDPLFTSNPKGPVADFTINPNALPGPDQIIENKAGANYIPGTEDKVTVGSVPAYIVWRGPTPFAKSEPAQGYIGRVAPTTTTPRQVIYDSMISQYTTLTGTNLAPFGGSFKGDSAPDGYGLGGQISASSRFIGDLFNYQQTIAASGADLPDVTPSTPAINSARTPVGAYDAAIFQAHNPFVTLTGALKSSVQGLQRSIALLYQNPPSQNAPAAGSPNTWSEQYFSLFDPVGRVIVNPTATQPALGVVSSIQNPPPISDTENKDKKGLSLWTPGMQWSGFGVSDQWNDQHYFYGYYLGAAALAGIFDHTWDANITGKPSSLWVDPSQMGMAIDQWLMSIAYDPDNPRLVGSLYRNSAFKYQKLSYFDQWNGHPWATGVSPGKAGDVERGTPAANATDNKDHPAVPWGIWNSYGTGNSNYNGENENSIFEGIQAWSAAILWGGATDRKPVVDLGMYLYSTNLAAGDAYFEDKNYNQSNSSLNTDSWVPVTTIHSKEVILNGGNELTPANSSYNETMNPSFYTAPAAFGGAASAGQSLLKKGENTLNNFFYAFPTGSKFIEAYPPAPWTMGMARNTNYMRRWAGAMMTKDWRDARDSALFQSADWVAMATTSALCGVPFNPGDVPYPGPLTPKPAVDPYINRLWSSWVTPNKAPGEEVTLNPPTLPITVLTFLLTLDQYGTPDWTYIAKVTDSTGADANESIVFTAALTKVEDTGAIKTSFVAFNPGWTTRYVNFYRLAPDGTISATPVNEAPIVVAPKRSKTTEQTFTPE